MGWNHDKLPNFGNFKHIGATKNGLSCIPSDVQVFNHSHKWQRSLKTKRRGVSSTPPAFIYS